VVTAAAAAAAIISSAISTLSVQLLVFLDYFSGVNRGETGTTTITISVSMAVFQVTWLSQPPCFSNLHVFWNNNNNNNNTAFI